MSDSDSPSVPEARRSTALVKLPEEPNPEPGSSPASAQPRGQTLWSRLKALFALRTASLRDDLEVALESEANGETADFSPSERTILQNVLQLGEKRVDDVMVPRADIEAIDADQSLGALLALFREVGHSRIPVYTETLDNITGFIHVKDALGRITEAVTDPAKDIPVRLVSPALKLKIGRLDLLRPVLFVPPSMPVGDLLQQMQHKRLHMAIVIDEYGGTDGVVTIEDLLEAVVGEIEDEHDDLDEAMVKKVNSNIYLANARAELEEVREVIGPDFDPGARAEEIDTVGGLVFDLAGRVPAKGEIIRQFPGFEFEVLASDARQIRRLKIKRVKTRVRGDAEPPQLTQ
ncbi:HlyC/CorC family transporter [Arsenicitalea aurantiaca]|uniref:HlyC/CorC family transporter n=1 Tax=Arsenicitalea aurantiaca TaxID=1783274 RepID=A0A433X817_9HYPH|nr:hemolysin family protein [Arsenicitalea aurantiaca]RUT30202.1 HlyC/CorC family transporter [Arsenicitalea aurantiaca]